MTLKGMYKEDETYQPGDVVLTDEGIAYRMQHPATAGVPPVDTAYWGRLSQELSDCVQLIVSYKEEAPKRTVRKK